MKNIHILPTDEPSRLIIYSKLLNEFKFLNEPISDWKHKKHIFITSNEEIKEGDYFICNDSVKKCNFIAKANGTRWLVDDLGNQDITKYCKKIILTNDLNLIKYGIQTIDDKFLEWFVKNSSCEFVEIKNKNICARCYSDNIDECWSTKECSDGRYNKIKYEVIMPSETNSCEVDKSDVKSVHKETKPHSFCETPEEKCTMNYCDENGCLLRKRVIVEPKLEPLEEVRNIKRTELFNSIYSIVKQIPRKEVDDDAMDSISCAYKLEQIFIKYQEDNIKNTFKEWNSFNDFQDSFNGKDDLNFNEWFDKYKKR